MAIDSIIYVEIKSGLLIFHMDETARPERKSRMTMRKLEEMLDNEGFLRIHSGYLAHMVYIQRLLPSSVTLRDGEFLMVSQHKYPEIKKKYLKWKGLGGNGMCLKCYFDESAGMAVFSVVRCIL